MSVLQQAGQQIISMTAEAVGALGTEFSEEQVRLEVPKDKSFGNFRSIRPCSWHLFCARIRGK